MNPLIVHRKVSYSTSPTLPCLTLPPHTPVTSPNARQETECHPAPFLGGRKIIGHPPVRPFFPGISLVAGDGVIRNGSTSNGEGVWFLGARPARCYPSRENPGCLPPPAHAQIFTLLAWVGWCQSCHGRASLSLLAMGGRVYPYVLGVLVSTHPSSLFRSKSWEEETRAHNLNTDRKSVV